MFRIENTSRAHCGTETTGFLMDDLKTTINGLSENDTETRGNLERLGAMIVSLSEKLGPLEKLAAKFEIMQETHTLHSKWIAENDKSVSTLNTRVGILEGKIE